ncbi:MAG: hypothetical protein AB8B51_05335 [Sedimentitalea sp.]
MLDETTIEQATLAPAAAVQDAPLPLEDISFTAATVSDPAQAKVTEPVKTVAAIVLPEAPVDPVTPNLGCDIGFHGTPGNMASVDLTVTAPCYGNARVTVHHNGMMFTETTSRDGQLEVTVPALNQDAVFIVEFTNGKGAVAEVDVPALADYDRVAVQWSGNTGFAVHAREFGAAYGGQGHAWSGSVDSAVGVVTQLGNRDTLAPQLAEIYTFPRGMSEQVGTVALTIETEVTDSNCGRDVAAQSLELRGSNQLRTRDLVLAMPDCTAIGDFLVLNNLVDDLKIALK